MQLDLGRGKNLDWYDDDPEEFDEMYYDGTWQNVYPELIDLDDPEECLLEEDDSEEGDPGY